MEEHDIDLLRKFKETRSEQAFSMLCSRYIALVYSVAIRQVQDAESAKDICQLVFLKLQEKAHTFDSKIILSGWLCRTTRFVCADQLKTIKRREIRERDYHMQNLAHNEHGAQWGLLSPVIDTAVGELRDEDQNILILRYFEKKPFANIAHSLGISEAAAKMRASRALDNLREILTSKGIVVSGVALGSAIIANAVQTLPIDHQAKILSAIKSSNHSATSQSVF